MLVTVKTQKFTLGRNIYLRGDVFECREAEARLLIASSLVVAAAAGVKATRDQPAPPTGLSLKEETAKQPAITRATKVIEQSKMPEQVKTPEPPKTTETKAAEQEEDDHTATIRRRVRSMMQSTGIKPKA